MSQSIESTSPSVPTDFQDLAIGDARQQFSTLLSLDEPVSEAVIEAIAENPDYLAHLIDKRHSGRLFEVLLANPPKTGGKSFTQPAVIGQVFGSLAKWAKSGFKTAPSDLVELRLSTCRACPNLRPPSGKILDRISQNLGMDGYTCGLCNCYIQPKAEMLTERCPDRDPDDPDMTRWSAQQHKLEVREDGASA